jgi:hypothetical protein
MLQQPADESLQKLMDRLILSGLVIAALAVILLVVFGAG